MKIYIMSKTINGDMKAPRASTDKEALAAEMNRQHDEVLKKAGHLAMDIGQLENGDLVAYYGGSRYVWRIDEAEI